MPVAMAAEPSDAERYIQVEDPETRRRLLTALAQALRAEGRIEEALNVLLKLEGLDPEDRDLQVAIAQAEVLSGRHDAAVRRLEVLRDAHPDWPRPRVELALAHEAAGDLGVAKAILIGELGKNPPPHVRRNLETRIRSLEDRQTFVGRLSVGVVPDSNVTGGTHNDSIEYFGLPFQVNDDAKAQSGVRGEVAVGGTVRTAWRRGKRLELAADLQHSQPLGDEGVPLSSVRLAVAARLRRPDYGLLAGLAVQPFYYDNALQRREFSWFGEGGVRLVGTTGLSGSLTLTRGEFAAGADRDFRQWELSLGPRFNFGRTVALHPAAIFGHRNAETDVYSFDRRGGSVNLVVAPGNGYRVTLAGALVRDRYKEIPIGFGVLQEDLIAAANLRLVKGDTVVWGFSPVFGLGYKDVRSSIDLYDRRSYSLQFGFARPY